MFKNVASQKLTVFAFADAGHATLDPGEPVTGDAANIAAQISKDDGTPAASNDAAPTEIDATDHPGMYRFDMTQAETNCDKIEFTAKSSTAGVQVVALPSGVIYTRPQYFSELGIESDGDLTKVNTLDGHTAQTADHTAGIADIPTVAEFNARTLVAASYFDPAADTVANVTTVATLTGHTAQTADHTAAIATVDANVDTLLTRITSTLFSGITSLAEWLGLIAGKQTGDATARTEIRATGAGSGTFDETGDSLEALRDRGDSAWTTGAGGSPPTTLQNTTIATLASQTSFTLTAGSADDDAYNGMMIVVTDQSTSEQKAVGVIDDYTGSTKTVTLLNDPGVFTMAVGDTVDVIAEAALKPSAIQDYHVQVNASGYVGGNVIQCRSLQLATPLFSSDLSDYVMRCDVNALKGVVARGDDLETLASDYVTDGYLDANLVRLGGTAQSATDLKDFADAGYDPVTNKVQGVVLVDTTTTNTDMRGTDSAALATALATAQTDLDTITGSDGVTLATTQANYAPAKASDILTTALTEAYATDGANATLSELLYMLHSSLSEFSISGTTKTSKKLDGSTTAMTHTLNDSANPTSITRAS